MVLSFVRSGSADINSGAVRVAGRHIPVSSGTTVGFVSPKPFFLVKSGSHRAMIEEERN